jgi:arylsulfatase A
MDLGTTMDLLPTFCSMANVELPGDRVYDGYDLFPVLSGTGDSPREVVYYYRGTQVYAILYVDPSEKISIAEKHPELILEIEKILEEHMASLVPVENQLEK